MSVSGSGGGGGGNGVTAVVMTGMSRTAGGAGGAGGGNVGMHNGGVHFSEGDGSGGGSSGDGEDEGDEVDAEGAGVAAVQNAMMHDRMRSDMERIVLNLFKQPGGSGISGTAGRTPNSTERT